ncbi:unnamed protein product [Vicia faba]|uniref:SNF2 N-terminal domain-containing protein n=1 Tax=Vicia faba TaxID=3906 RepID=A0AAV0ZQB1_VICFA|nr:unnamed protein product [Vicia faba]
MLIKPTPNAKRNVIVVVSQTFFTILCNIALQRKSGEYADLKFETNPHPKDNTQKDGCVYVDAYAEEDTKVDAETSLPLEDNTRKDKGVMLTYTTKIIRLMLKNQEDTWREMFMALETSKDVSADHPLGEEEKKKLTVITLLGIETIFEFQYKVKRSTRTYMFESWNGKAKDDLFKAKIAEDDLTVIEISAHPRHANLMKLVGDHPGGCILAHAPGSGKTFMVISFIQSFLGKYPNARPLVVLPKGILSTWKKEFQRWQVEDVPLYDFYTVMAESRSQQLEVLKQWVDHKNEGHTPRNENTDMVQSLAKVQTPSKVVLSGTLYQNHVKEVFNVLNLVRPKFKSMETSKPIVRRIKSRIHIPGVSDFCDLVENTLQKDPDFKRKVDVIHDLREMTSKVLHYYKGDFLDELPGLVDFTVVLKLTPRQMHELDKVKGISGKFKMSSVGSAVYLHQKLKPIAEKWCEKSISGDIIDDLIRT